MSSSMNELASAQRAAKAVKDLHDAKAWFKYLNDKLEMLSKRMDHHDNILGTGGAAAAGSGSGHDVHPMRDGQLPDA